jgi:hypothetical protein
MHRLFVTSLFVVSIAPPISAQTKPGAPASPPTAVAGAGCAGSSQLIDGSRNPELIDTELLAMQLLAMLALPRQPSVMQERAFETLSGRIGLSGSDTNVLRQEMNLLYEALTPIRARLNAGPGSDTRSALEAFRAVRLESYGRLLELLSDKGAKRFQDWIEREKRNTKRSAPCVQ